mgnify:CR=1 FL=1
MPVSSKAPENKKDVDTFRFDVSKTAQWEKVMQYADKKGIFLHFKTFERENITVFNSTERKLYYRELIARFGHHLALNWNLSEEILFWDEAQDVRDTIQFIKDTDPYDHLTVFLGEMI